MGPALKPPAASNTIVPQPGGRIQLADCADHADVVKPHHRFANVWCRGQLWDLAHLDAFAFRYTLAVGQGGTEVDVVVLFSCHCFSRSLRRDGRSPRDIPGDEIFTDGIETRVLDEDRYAASRVYLPRLVQELGTRTIRVAASDRQNFVTFETMEGSRGSRIYAVFFEPRKDTSRRRRIILRVQSAYVLEALTRRLANAGKVGFDKLLNAVYSGGKIRG